MDPLELQLETDLATAAQLLEARPSAAFALPANRFREVAKDKIKADRRGLRALIKPDNAQEFAEKMPACGEQLHAILRGDFVLCDVIPAIIRREGRCHTMHLATLGLSAGNASLLASLIDDGLIGDLTLLCSLYFQQVDKTTTYRQVRAHLEDKATIIIARNHVKLIAMQMDSGAAFVIGGSGNLRSSDNIEYAFALNDQELLAWHVEWINHLAAHA
jgi:hypothetical protein